MTFLYTAPPYLRDLLDAQRGAPRDLTALRWLVSGSAPMPPHYVDEVREEFGVRLFSLWGMTENGPVTISRIEDPEDWAAHSDGSPISDMELRIDPIPGEPDGVGTLVGARALRSASATTAARTCTRRTWTPTAGSTPTTSHAPTGAAASASRAA